MIKQQENPAGITLTGFSFAIGLPFA